MLYRTVSIVKRCSGRSILVIDAQVALKLQDGIGVQGLQLAFRPSRIVLERLYLMHFFEESVEKHLLLVSQLRSPLGLLVVFVLLVFAIFVLLLFWLLLSRPFLTLDLALRYWQDVACKGMVLRNVI